MNRERLGSLATMLEAYKPSDDGPRFDLHSWGEFREKRGGFLWLRKHPCDTAACAVGLACISRAFQAEGLSFLRTEDLDIVPTFAGSRGWNAVRAFFDLTEKQARRLFYDRAYRVSVGEVAAKAVAKRIHSMIAQRKRKPKKPKTDISSLTAILAAPDRDPDARVMALAEPKGTTLS